MISVIVPVYNTEAYLSRCLESILGQTCRDLQVICVNDGSTDGSGAILEDFRRRDNRMEVVCRRNSGLSASRNAGLELARGNTSCSWMRTTGWTGMRALMPWKPSGAIMRTSSSGVM